MSGISSLPQLGQVVEILKGKETGTLAVIVGIVDAKTLLLADGAKRPGNAPKRKNSAHVRLLDFIDQSIVQEIEHKGQVQNAKLRYCLNRYEAQTVRKQNRTEAHEGK